MIHTHSVSPTIQRRKEGKKKDEKSDPGPHEFTRPMDITRPRTTSSRCGTLTFPHRDDEIQRSGSSGQFSGFTEPMNEARYEHEQRANLHETRRFRRRVPLRDAVMDARAELKRESETKRSAAQTGPN